MADETHPVIDLLIARIQSHPKEFTEKPFRWEVFVQRALDTALEADHIKLHVAIAKVQMDKLHEEVMDELLNGEDRRAALAEEEKLAKAAAYAVSQGQQAARANALQSLGQSTPMTNAIDQANNYAFYTSIADSSTISGAGWERPPGTGVLTEKSLMDIIRNATKGKGAK